VNILTWSLALFKIAAAFLKEEGLKIASHGGRFAMKLYCYRGT
jgi:hypothetical protein